MTCVYLPSKEYCWVGKGCFLERFTLEGSHENCQRYTIFPDGGTVHGLRQNGEIMVIFGGRKVSVWKSRDDTDLAKLSLKSSCSSSKQDYILASDWIWDLRISPTQQEHVLSKIALALANNACEIWIICNDLSVQRTHKINGSTRSLTYSMSLHGWQNRSPELILASGTVFNEIIIWTVMDAAEAVPVTTRHDTHRLRGHHGVILSVQFSEDGMMLASTSDDRSVRLWKYENAGWQCAWVSWGHSARVWSIAFSSVGLVSTAEDASARIWDLLNGNQLGEIRSYTCHSLWRVNVFENWALIGGNDGSAKLYDLESKAFRQENTNNIVKTYSTVLLVPDDRKHFSYLAPEVEDVDENTFKNGKKKSKPELASQVIFGMEFCVVHGHRCLIITTRSGSTLSLSMDDLNWSNISPWWLPSIDNVEATDGSCIAVNEKLGTLVVGTTRGDILISPLVGENHNIPTVGTAHKYKSIHSVSWIETDSFVAMHINGIAILWCVSDKGQLLRKRIFRTGLGAIPTCCCVDRRNNLVVGDSRGNLIVFEIDGQGAENKEIPPISLGSKFHKKEHVNAVVCHRDRFLSVGNDGCVHESYLGKDGVLNKSISVPCATLSGLTHIWANNDSVVVAGYHGNIFIALDRVTGYEEFRVETGGRQRNLACVMAHTGYGVGVCVSNKDGSNSISLHVAVAMAVNKGGLIVPSRRNLGAVLHGEPVFDISIFSSAPDANYAMLLTGSEDCSSKVMVIKDDLVIHSILLPPQESGIRAVSTSRHHNSRSTLLVQCGGKLVINFFLLVDCTDNKEAMVTFDLSVSFLKTGRFLSKSTVDHRINAVCSVPLESEDGKRWHAVATGDSNGCVNLFLVSENVDQRSAATSLLLSGDLRAVLSLCFLRVGNRLLIFAGTTGGDIIIWSLHSTWEHYENQRFDCAPIWSYKAHQSGTNSIDARLVSTEATRSNIRICSGGDDQAITVCSAILNNNYGENLAFNALSLHTSNNASRSAIKGVKLITVDRLLSVGYSQRLAMWEINTESCELTLSTSTPIDIADVSSLSLFFIGGAGELERSVAVIGGEGVELQQIMSSNMNP